MKTNCWQHKQCGREPGGVNVSEGGVCPAAIEWTLNGVHGGKNSGRVCWFVAGTFCGGKAQGTYAEKLETCEQCDFFQTINREEHDGICQRIELYWKMNLHLRKNDNDTQAI